MKEDYKNIFKRHFDKHLDDTDPQEMWEAIKIKKGIQPKRKRRIVAWLWPMAIGIFVVSSFIFKQTDKGAKVSPSVATTSSLSNDLNATVEISQEAQGKYLKELQNKDLTEVHNKDLTEVQNKDLTEVQDESIIRSKEFNEISVVGLNNDNEKIKYESINGSGLTEDADYVEQVNSTFLDPMKQNLFEDIWVNSKLEDQGVVEKKSVISFNEIDEAVNVDVNSRNGLIEFTKVSSISAVLLEDLKQDYHMPILGVDLLGDKNIGDKNESQSSKKLSLKIGSTYGIITSEYSGIDASEEAYAMLRAASESNLEALSTGVLIDFQVHRNFSISTGLGYRRINELFQLDNTFVRNASGPHLTGIEVGIDGSENYVYSNGSFQELVTAKMKIYNKADLLRVPLNLSLIKSIGPVSVSLFGGVEANVLIGEEGYILGENDAVLNLESIAPSKFGMSIGGGMGIEYSIGERIGLAGTLSYSNLNKQQLGVNVRYGIVDLGMSLRYRF